MINVGVCAGVSVCMCAQNMLSHYDPTHSLSLFGGYILWPLVLASRCCCSKVNIFTDTLVRSGDGVELLGPILSGPSSHASVHVVASPYDHCTHMNMFMFNVTPQPLM